MDFEHGATFVAALGALITAIVTAYIGIRNMNRNARKDEVQLLRDEVQRLSRRLESSDKHIQELERENRALHRQVAALGAENVALRAVLQAHGIEVPVLPPIENGAPGHDTED